VFVGIVAGFLLLRLLAPDVAIAASQAAPNASGVSALQADVATEDAASELPGAPLVALPAPSSSPTSTVRTAAPQAGAASMAEPIVLAARSGTRVAGTASTYGPAFGPGWLALPEGAGIRVRVCGPATCIERVSNDAGPDLAMQRAGRIVDLSVRDFELVCGCSWQRGLVPVTLERLP
jgi:hypothetical protein